MCATQTTTALRAMDQGFQESLVLNGGGIGQPSDPVGGESYVDPMLRRNGAWVKTRGYVSDVITDAAIAFIHKHQRRPFFACNRQGSIGSFTDSSLLACIIHERWWSRLGVYE